jgi:hypothetical protein
MKLNKLESTWNYAMDVSKMNQFVEWHGKIYLLGIMHIHKITKDFL